LQGKTTKDPGSESVKVELPAKSGGRRGLAAWCLYDWANSAFPTVITTFIFAAYFTQAVAPTPAEGTVLWSRAVTVVGLVVAVVSPLLGAISDNLGPRKPWLLAFSALCACLTGLLWLVEPSTDFVMTALVLYAVASIAYQFAIVFYDAMLPNIAPRGMLGRISGWGWALGYVGGLACLVACLWIVKGGGAEAFALDAERAEHVRATSVLVAIWFVVFSLPLFILTPDRSATGLTPGAAVRAGLRQLGGTLGLLRRNPPISRFLIAHMLYTDGLFTLFAFGGIYAAAEFGMEPADILVFGIVLNIAAGAGAAGFAWLDDAIGSKRTILLALAGLILAGVGLVLVRVDWHFWVFALLLGVCVGPAQAAGRSLMARLAPERMETEMFGLYALAGKATAFAGPFVLGLVVSYSGSQRAGMVTIVVFLLLGGLVLLSVREPRFSPSSVEARTGS
jgi:UMF1 family MFS transporter